MPPLGVIVILGLAAYRTSRLVAVDTLTENLRARVYHWAYFDNGKDEPAARGSLRTYTFALLDCPYCIGVWAAAGAYAWYRWLALWPITIAAVAGVAALCTSWDARVED